MGTKWKHNKEWPEGYRGCTKCNKVKPLSAFHKHKECYLGVNSVCKVCREPLSKTQYQSTSIEYKLWTRAMSRAKRRGREFNIDISDIVVPERCPILNRPLIPNTEDAPSLDRIDSTKGYIKGNVRVISKRANALKNNFNYEELRNVLMYLQGEI